MTLAEIDGGAQSRHDMMRDTARQFADREIRGIAAELSELRDRLRKAIG